MKKTIRLSGILGGILLFAVTMTNSAQAETNKTAHFWSHYFTFDQKEAIENIAEDELREAMIEDTEEKNKDTRWRNTIGNRLIKNNSIRSKEIKDGTVDTVDLHDEAVTTEKLNDDAVTNEKLADDSVTSANIVNGTIMNIDINTNAGIDPGKINFDGADIDLGTGSLTTTDITATGTVDLSGADTLINSGTSTPGNCSVGEIFIDTDGDTQDIDGDGSSDDEVFVFVCTSSDNWDPVVQMN